MSWENALLTEFSNDVEKYEIEVTKMDQNNPHFLQYIYASKNSVGVDSYLILSYVDFSSHPLILNFSLQLECPVYV